jgi:CRP/FNR family transcriptional regulator
MHTAVDLSKIRVTCRVCSLSELCLPRGLDARSLQLLDGVVQRSAQLRRNDRLFRAGDTLDSLYAVRSGSLKLQAMTDDGREQIIGFYFPGELIGLDALATGHHVCTAVALETSSTCSIPFARLSDVCRQVPGLQDQMFRLMGRELTADSELLMAINRKTADARIAGFLLSLSRRLQRLGYSANEFRLSMSRQEIGDYLGLTVETVSRVFSRLNANKAITTRHRLVRILDPARLQAVSSGSTPADAD